MPTQQLPKNLDGDILALDIGDSRIGIARAHTIARLPEPLPTLKNDENFIKNLQNLIDKHKPVTIIAGAPYNRGEQTAQTLKVIEFVDNLKQKVNVPILLVDESYTSKDADDFLSTNTKLKYDQDSVAACYILSEYLK